MTKEMTTCEYDGTPETWKCSREEQCDECYLKDNPLKVNVVHDTNTRIFREDVVEEVGPIWQNLSEQVANAHGLTSVPSEYEDAVLIADQEQRWGEAE